MYIKIRGPAYVAHSASGIIYKAEPDEASWEVISADERGMGPDRLWQGETDHEELGLLRWQVSEYPEGFLGQVIPDLNGHESIRNLSVSIEYEPDGRDDEEEDFDKESISFDPNEASEEMKQWFYENYEDPANSLPYNSAEGGYQWIYGGPTTPLDALQEGFSQEYPFELLERVAKQITNSDGLWDWSPKPGADFYEEVEEEEEAATGLQAEDGASELSRRMPLAEELIQNPQSGIFSVRPREPANVDLLSATLAQLADAIEDVLAGESNGLNASSLEIRKLRRTLDRYANDPQRVEMDLTSVHYSIIVQIANGELPSSSENLALLAALQEGAQGIRATDHEIAANRRLLQERALKELPRDTLDQIAGALPTLEAITEGDLRKQMREDVLYLTQDLDVERPRLPGYSKADAIVPGHDEAVRVFGRAARMLIALRRAPDMIHKLHDSAGFRLVNVLVTLVSLGKLLF